MARTLLSAGYEVAVCDLDVHKVEALVRHGARAVQTPAAAVGSCGVTFVSLPTSGTFVKVAEQDETGLIAGASKGKVVIDAGTTSPPETRRLARAFAVRETALVDAPVSGGGRGANAGTLAVMVGGDERAVARVMPLLEVIGGRVVHLGPSGSGQLGKAVNQIAMGVADAAFLEAMHIGVQGGLDPAKIWDVLSAAGAAATSFERSARAVIDGTAGSRDCKLRELPYFIEEARANGCCLPLTEALYSFCEGAEDRTADPLGIPTPSFWHELVHRRRGA
jgi:3-hydroxyisobutyrate dehydrogenase-like beta-hydroxyacid dehydrogenase